MSARITSSGHRQLQQSVAGQADIAKVLMFDEARRIAVNVAPSRSTK
jgi:hypothetical protein